MKIAVISDLHLGTRDAADAFGHDDSDFLHFLTFLERNFERVVLLGDIWETLTPRRYGDAARQLRRARRSHPEIARRFSSRQYSYIHGNHDLIAGHLEAAPEELALEADGMRLLFTHGHQNDGLIHRARWISELGVWIGGWVRRIGMGPLYRIGHKLDQLRAGVTREAGGCDFQRWAVEVATLRSADVVITGHTHLATRAEHGSRLYLNSGSCSQGAYSFLALDTRAGVFGVHTGW
jgi:predicted phosphodiesterase